MLCQPGFPKLTATLPSDYPDFFDKASSEFNAFVGTYLTYEGT
jgi:hypothetical protein